MQKKPVIPTPPGQRWREFRFRVIPRVAVAIVFAAVIFFWRQSVLPPANLVPLEARHTEVSSPNSGYITNLYVVRFQEVKKDDLIAKIVTFESSSKAQIAILRAPISGAVSMIYRTEGQSVQAGEPILQITDRAGHSQTLTNVAFFRREITPALALPSALSVPAARDKLRASSDLAKFARRD